MQREIKPHRTVLLTRVKGQRWCIQNQKGVNLTTSMPFDSPEEAYDWAKNYVSTWGSISIEVINESSTR